mmetsp:Transcript_48539/g.153797  ORF Transcript_48539/g.153797 Transcript_48539/m.153797 type:complete len:269 (-) Transcript_48539:401-1207(-)
MPPAAAIATWLSALRARRASAAAPSFFCPSPPLRSCATHFRTSEGMEASAAIPIASDTAACCSGGGGGGGGRLVVAAEPAPCPSCHSRIMPRRATLGARVSGASHSWFVFGSRRGCTRSASSICARSYEMPLCTTITGSSIMQRLIGQMNWSGKQTGGGSAASESAQTACSSASSSISRLNVFSWRTRSTSSCSRRSWRSWRSASATSVASRSLTSSSRTASAPRCSSSAVRSSEPTASLTPDARSSSLRCMAAIPSTATPVASATCF